MEKITNIVDVKIFITAFIAGVIFAIGLMISGMSDPKYVLGFLNFGGYFYPERLGNWYPRLAFVMIGAVIVMMIVFYWTKESTHKITKPILADNFNLPTKKKVDKQLVLGSIIFGIGWGLVGYCPGPAFAIWFMGNATVWIFVLALIIGIILGKKVQASLNQETSLDQQDK